MTEKQRKENIEKYVKQMELEKIWSGKGEQEMLNYFSKKLENIIELEDGSMIAIEKPGIITYIGTGYSECGQGPTYEVAKKMAELKKKDFNYFINYNIQCSEIMRYLESLNNEYCEVYTANRYYGCSQDTKLKQLIFVKCEEKEQEGQRFSSKFKDISKADINKIINTLEEALERYKKRLNTYLKRYGLSKCDFDLYWIDR